MSNSSWKKLLAEKLKPPAKNSLRLAIVGVGAELNGDDAVGMLVAQQLRKIAGERQNVLILEGGTLPENTIGALRQFSPETVILIDAANLMAVPGTVEWVDWHQIRGGSFSTHSMPLSILCDYIEKEIGCKTQVLGIQPESIEFGQPISQECLRSANQVVMEFSKLLGRFVDEDINATTV